MRHLATIFCLTFTLIFGTAGTSHSADFDKGWKAYQTEDYATALREWTPLAEQGDAEAQFSLGVMYEHGQGVPQDNKAAVKLYRLAAEQGVAKAQFNLGVMYHKGQGVPQDYKTAVKLYRLAAEQGFAKAQFNLGVMYHKGQGVPQNHTHAHMWLNIARSDGYKKAAEAIKILGKIMSPAQITMAQGLARECVAKNY